MPFPRQPYIYLPSGTDLLEDPKVGRLLMGEVLLYVQTQAGQHVLINSRWGRP